jgi:hypothetical protein
MVACRKPKTRSSAEGSSPLESRRQHDCDLLRRSFQPVQRGVAPSTERGVAGLTAKCLDPLSMAMLAISLDDLRTIILYFPQRLSYGITTRLSQNRQHLSLLLVRVSGILRYADQPSSRRNKQAQEADASSTVFRSACAGLLASLPLTSSVSMMGGRCQSSCSRRWSL